MTNESGCPYCGSTNIKAWQDQFEFSTEIVHQFVEMRCNDCKKSFEVKQY